MTTASSPNRHEFWPWFGHYAQRLFLAFYSLLLVNTVITGIVTGHVLFVAFMVTFVITIILVITLTAQMRHDTKLCERCISEMPLDGQTQAEKYRRQLRLAHYPADHKRIAFAYIGLFGIIGVIPNLIGHLLFVTVMIPFLLFERAFIRHRRLQPWCPWCHWGRDDDDDPIVTPTPDPVGEHQLT